MKNPQKTKDALQINNAEDMNKHVKVLSFRLWLLLAVLVLAFVALTYWLVSTGFPLGDLLMGYHD